MIDQYLQDQSITEFMCNGFDKAFIERTGRLTEIPSPFSSEADYEWYVESLIEQATSTTAGGLIIDGILPDGSRFHITRPPLSPFGSSLTIRKFVTNHFGMDGLVKSGFLSEKCAVFLKACVKARVNILVSGATGAGKTTLLNVLASNSDPDERIITVEDVAEVKLQHKNWIRLLASRSANGVGVRECLVSCLRMRPDRIIVGECRSSEALEMLQIMNTGHDGGMTTIHANSSSEALGRLESLVLFHAGAEIPIRALRKQIVDAIDLIIHVGRTANGGRRIEEVMEVVGMEGEVITRSTLFKLNSPTGHVPTFIKRLVQAGISLPIGFFDTVAPVSNLRRVS